MGGSKLEGDCDVKNGGCLFVLVRFPSLRHSASSKPEGAPPARAQNVLVHDHHTGLFRLTRLICKSFILSQTDTLTRGSLARLCSLGSI